MKRNWVFKLIYIITAIIVVINTAISVQRSLFSDIQKLPRGEFAYSVPSPSGECKMNIYVVKNSLGVAVRGELESGKESKNVFWQTDISDVNVFWANEESVMINNIPLNITKGDDYDCRRGTSIFADGATYERILNGE